MSNLNVDLFYFINGNLQNPFFDLVMPAVTNLGGFISLFSLCVLVIVLSVIFKWRNIKKIALLCLLSLLIADGIALILKILVLEPRPFVSLDNVRLLISENDMSSFPSGHTTSTFAVLFALIFRLKNRMLNVMLILFSLLIGFSRVYVGVHYPFDIFAGAVIGILSAYLVYMYENSIGDLAKRMGWFK